MNAVVIICSIIAGLCILLGLLLSKSGTSSGLASMSGQDMEIFKKSKDRGWSKIFQITMILCSFSLLIIALVFKFIS